MSIFGPRDILEPLSFYHTRYTLGKLEDGKELFVEFPFPRNRNQNKIVVFECRDLLVSAFSAISPQYSRLKIFFKHDYQELMTEIDDLEALAGEVRTSNFRDIIRGKIRETKALVEATPASNSGHLQALKDIVDNYFAGCVFIVKPARWFTRTLRYTSVSDNLKELVKGARASLRRFNASVSSETRKKAR